MLPGAMRQTTDPNPSAFTHSLNARCSDCGTHCLIHVCSGHRYIRRSAFHLFSHCNDSLHVRSPPLTQNSFSVARQVSSQLL